MKSKVLVFPCGSEVGLEIYRSLKFSKDFEVFGASSVDDHGRFVFENYIPDVPFVDSDEFINQINAIVTKYKIDFIFPAHDSAVLKLVQNSDQIKAQIISSPLKTCEIARSKRKTYEVFREVIRTPCLYESIEYLSFPVFLKPDVGQGSKGTLMAKSAEEVKVALVKDSSLLILEYLPGDEYTIDCFTDKSGKLLFSQARQRTRISNGISVNSRVVKGAVFREIAQKINKTLSFCGVWFFQLRKNVNGELTLLEIAPRVAGTMALCRMQGVNLPLLSLYNAMDRNIYLFINNFDIEIDRALTAKYKIDIEFDTVYVDFDDTIILEDKANYLVIGLLYKFIEEKKKIILITKHLKIVEETLAKHKVSIEIFDNIIALSGEDEKSKFMSNDSIFIDDSFSERKSVFETLGIPVFDVSEAVELL